MSKVNVQAIQSQINNQGLSDSGTKHSTEHFSSEQQQLVNWFFAMMRTAWGQAKYNSQFGGEEDLRFAKRYWAKRILAFSRQQLTEIIELSDRERINGNPRFEWPDVAAILSLQSGSWERQCHREFRPERQLVDLTSRERNQRVGSECLAQLRGMFGSRREATGEMS